ncbi:putative nuclease HARBI1 [Phlebotomus papatasi]|uniref:putative nuclease HARBI1 n=1 Tax=Phlebotomus papatasi TaxID=29031 RepID=UPI002483CC05|nr:putative nuclease HARBI1 [Phlebotomus papatasi]
MSRKYNKQRFINFLEQEAICDLLDVNEEEERTGQVRDDLMEAAIDRLMEGLLIMITHRYLYRTRVPKSSAWYERILPQYDPSRFLQMLRVSREEFDFILNEITDDLVFTVRARLQLPVEKQLAIVLYRLGGYGDSASLAKTAAMLGTGDGGTLDKVTQRVFSAILRLKPQYLYWPDAEERRILTRETADELILCVGYMDGTEFKLAEAPIHDPDSYYSRKKVHSIKATLVCDHRFRVRYLAVGVPGSVHDARMFVNIELGQRTEEFLTGDEYIAADSAYKCTERVITPYRQNSRAMTAQERRQFNRIFSSYRVRVEQVFGDAKETFQSLKELRFRLGTEENYAYCCNWVMVCFIVYNMLLKYKMDRGYRIVFDDIGEINDDPIEEELQMPAGNDAAERKRQYIYEHMLQNI